MATAIIPTDYDELVVTYQPFIAAEIRRANTVTTNFEDALQDVLVRLMEARVIERFHDRSVDHPPTMTGAEAAAFIGVSFHTFSVRLYGYHRGHSRPGKGLVREKTPLPSPLTGLISSMTATYRGEDIVNMSLLTWRNRHAGVVVEKSPPTPYQFMNYLGVAVRNHFANFCRTRSRRWKDRTADTVGGAGDVEVMFRTADGGYNTSWEETLKDDHAEDRLAAQVVLTRMFDKLQTHGLREDHVTARLAEGYTLVEAIQKSGLSRFQKATCLRVCVEEFHMGGV